MMDELTAIPDSSEQPRPSKVLRWIVLSLVVIIALRLLAFPLTDLTSEGHNVSLMGLTAVLFATIAPLLCAILGIVALLVCVMRLFRGAPGRFAALFTSLLCGASAFWLITLIPH